MPAFLYLSTSLRWQPFSEHLHRLGVRGLHDFLLELAEEVGPWPIEVLLTKYSGQSPNVLQALGGHRFPPQPFRVVDGGRQ